MKYAIYTKIKKMDFELILIGMYGAKNISCVYLNLDSETRIPRFYMFKCNGKEIATWGSGTGTIFEREKK